VQQVAAVLARCQRGGTLVVGQGLVVALELVFRRAAILQHARVGRLELERAVVGGDRLLAPAERFERDAVLVVEGGIAGLDRDRLRLAAHGFLRAPEVDQHGAESVVCPCEPRGDLDRAAQVALGTLGISRAPGREAAVVVRGRVRGIARERAIVSGQRLGGPAHVHQQVAYLAMQLRVVRLVLRRAAEARHRLVEAPEAPQRDAHVLHRARVARLELERFLEALEGVATIAHGRECDAEVGPRERDLRRSLHAAPQQGHRRGRRAVEELDHAREVEGLRMRRGSGEHLAEGFPCLW
jgi:hypothetical protein